MRDGKFMLGFFIGGLLCGAAISFTWKSAVQSGDYFNLGNDWFYCKQAEMQMKDK